MYRLLFKRILDFILASFLLIIISPLFIILSFLVLIFHGRPIFFVQRRPGYREKVFNMYKFRSMTNERDSEGNLLSSNFRVTKLGNFLRKTSLDELPELFNILKGDMSFIGPRPFLENYLPYYEENERKRHLVRPGLTGLAQVKGRNIMTWRERFAYDIQYVDNLSFLLDLKIFFATIIIVLTKKNVADAGEVETDEFGDYLLYNGYKYRPFDKEREYERYLKECEQRDGL